MIVAGPLPSDEGTTREHEAGYGACLPQGPILRQVRLMACNTLRRLAARVAGHAIVLLCRAVTAVRGG